MSDITITNIENAAAVLSFQIMRSAGRELPIPVQCVFDRIERKAKAEHPEFEKARVALCEKFAAKDGQGNPMRLENGDYDIPDLDAFQAAFQPIANETVTLSGVRKVTLAELGDVKITRVEYDGLRPFIVDPDGE